MTLPVPGGILAQLAPAGATGLDPTALATMMAMAKNANQPPAPGSAPPPPTVTPPTTATNAAPPPVDMGAGAQPLDHIDAPPLQADNLPTVHRGILGSIGDTLHDPNFRAEALRFAMGAMSPGGGGFGGGLSRGILAATQFADQRKADAEKTREFDAEQALKGRGLDLQGQEINNNFALGREGHAVQEYGINTDAATTRRGQDVSERSNIRDNSTHLTMNREDNQTSRANTHEQVGASILNNNNDNATARDVAAGRNATDIGVATINAGTKGQLDPKDAMHGLGMVLPGLLGTNDAAGVAKALQSSPDLQAQLVDAYTKGYGTGGPGAMERATAAVKSVLGNGASYTSDNHPFIPFMGQPEITPGSHDAPAQGGGKQIVRTGTDKATGKKVVQYSDGTISYAD